MVPASELRTFSRRLFALLEKERKADGAVVGALDVGVDEGVGEMGTETIGDDEIIDTPTGVLLTRLKTVRPPGIFDLLRIEVAESIRKTCIQQVRELRPLLISETRIMTIRLGILDVNLLMRHIQVTTKDHRFLGIQTLQISPEVILPRHTII